MNKLVLVDEAVFPITRNANGSLISKLPKTGWNISGTVQGEGKLAGVPSLFIRLASCNLRCMWTLPNGKLCHCDTSYASFNPKNSSSWDVQDIVDTVRNNIDQMNHIVITGGEPLLQKEPLAVLCKELKKQLNVHITIETNGTIFDENVAKHVDLASISPKLKNSNPSVSKTDQMDIRYTGPFKYHQETRKQIDVIQSWINSSAKHNNEFQLKFVVANNKEEDEIKSEYLLNLTDFEKNDIILMPLGTNNEELEQTTTTALKMAINNGWRFTPRVHIDLFGCKSGV